MSLYWKYIGILFKSQVQYRTSFWLLILGQLLVPFSTFAGFYFLFDRFGQIKGWSFYEASLCFGVVYMAFTISELLARGFDAFSSLVGGGDFDRLLVRPRGTVLQVLGSKFDFTRIGRFIQGLIVLVWSIIGLPIDWTWMKSLTLILMIGSGSIIFIGIFMLGATLCFWTIQGMELTNILSDGGREMAQYPLDIYSKWVTRFFTFIIPFACFNYLPLLYLLDRTEGYSSYLYPLLPVIGSFFMLPCVLVWRFGVRHYRSTGS